MVPHGNHMSHGPRIGALNSEEETWKAMNTIACQQPQNGPAPDTRLGQMSVGERHNEPRTMPPRRLSFCGLQLVTGTNATLDIACILHKYKLQTQLSPGTAASPYDMNIYHNKHITCSSTSKHLDPYGTTIHLIVLPLSQHLIPLNDNFFPPLRGPPP